MRRVYLDVCALCRPFDDQSRVRIRLETTAVELILSHVRQKQIELIVSPVHDVEISAITEVEERAQLNSLLKQIGTRMPSNLVNARSRTEELETRSLGLADSAHLAFAEQAQADFVTVDDRLIKQYSRINPVVWCGTPLTYCEKENLK